MLNYLIGLGIANDTDFHSVWEPYDSLLPDQQDLQKLISLGSHSLVHPGQA